MYQRKSIVVVVPAYNEERQIGKVIEADRKIVIQEIFLEK